MKLKTNQFVKVKFLAFLFVMMTSLFFAQNDPSYIDSSGQIEYAREVEKYKVTIVVSEDLAYSSYNENITFDKIKSDYFDKLQSNNFDVSEFKEDQLAYAAMGYRKKGVVYQFETTSEEKFVKLMSIGFSGVNINEKIVYYKPLTSHQIEDLSRRAISQAKSRADLIAKSAGKK